MNQLNKILVLQQGEVDCGVACLLSIINYYQGTDSLENLRRLSGTAVTGTTMLGLYQAAQSTGFEVQGCEGDIASLAKHDAPCILHVIKNNLQHYVVFFGCKNEKFIIGDPANGVSYMCNEDLETIWKSRACLLLKPGPAFKKAKDKGKAKKNWIKSIIKEDLPFLSVAAVLGIAIAGLGVVMSIFSQRLIDDILPGKSYTRFGLGIALVFFLLLSREGFIALRQYFLIRQSREFNSRIIDFFYTHLLNLPKSFFDTRKTGELTARLNDTARIQRVISQLAGNFVIDILITLVSTVFIFTYSVKAGLGCLLAMPVFYFIIFAHNKKIKDGQRSVLSNYAATESNYISTFQGIESIKNFNKQAVFSENNKKIYRSYQDKIIVLGKIQIRLSFLANSFGHLFLIAILCFTGLQVLGGSLRTGELIAILGMCGTLLPSVANLALINIPLNEARIAFDRMFEFTGIETENEMEDDQPHEIFSLKAEHLAFRFRGRSPIFKDVSLELKKGEIVAIVGENGSGKTTLIQILQRYYEVESGRMLVNNTVQAESISLTAWRKMLGVVPQHVHIFNGTVLDNIAFDNSAKHEDVLDFLVQFGFGPFLDSLPQSWMTLLGEEGINLSGGQKQMIALARALYHRPQFLILDEATSAMDRQSEQFVFDIMQKIKDRVGILMITHRLQILKLLCDRIYILEQGVISIKGDHNQLLKTNNIYSKYWRELVQEPV